MLIRNAEVGAQFESARRTATAEQPLVDVRCADGSIVEIGRDLAPISGEAEIDAAGGALIPGLHDHHIHLTALAAARSSIACGPPEVGDRSQLRDSLRAAGRGERTIASRRRRRSLLLLAGTAWGLPTHV